MAMVDELTDAEIDVILEKFDKTEPALQRRIIAEAFVELEDDRETNAKLIAACRALPTFDLDNPDAADFKDNAGKFMTAMRLAREALADIDD